MTATTGESAGSSERRGGQFLGGRHGTLMKHTRLQLAFILMRGVSLDPSSTQRAPQIPCQRA